MKRLTVKKIEKAAELNDWRLFSYSDNDQDFIAVNIQRSKGYGSVTHHFKIIGSSVAMFYKTYSTKTRRTLRNRNQRKEVESLIFRGLNKITDSQKSLIFKLSNSMVTKGMSRRTAFNRAMSIIRDPGSIPISKDERLVLMEYGYNPDNFKYKLNRVGKYQFKQAIQSAIYSKNLIKIYYTGDENVARGARIVEPFVYGTWKRKGKTRRGKISYILRAYQVKGSSSYSRTPTNPIPGWRAFRLDKISYMEILEDTYSKPRPGYNPTGDKQLNKVIIQAKF